MLERIGIVLSLTVNHARSVIATQITFSECLTWHGTTVRGILSIISNRA